MPWSPSAGGVASAVVCCPDSLILLSRRSAAAVHDQDVFHIMSTTRAMRRLKPDAVPDEVICRILQAGMSAANAGNRQQWRFLVVKDRAVMQAVQRLYKRAYDEVAGPAHKISGPPAGVSPEKYERQNAAVEYLTDHLHEAPVWIVPCLDTRGQVAAGPARSSGATIYPAVQNMLLAARALGIGAT